VSSAIQALTPSRQLLFVVTCGVPMVLRSWDHEGQMAKVLVRYYSTYGHVALIAGALAAA
jgi:hypothetical protein